MAVTKENIDKKGTGKKKILRKLLAAFFAFLLIVVMLLFLTQTSFFRNWLKDYVLNRFNEEFADKETVLSVESLYGNLFSEIVIKNASLKVQKDRMIGFDELKLRYDIFALFDKRVFIKEAMLLSPKVNFVKIRTPSGDSLWNYQYVFATDEKKEEEVSEFNWKIIAERVMIEDLNFRMLASRQHDIPVTELIQKDEDFLIADNFSINGFNLECSLEYSKDVMKLFLYHLGFRTNFGFTMRGMSGDFYVSDSRTEINNLNIETSRSWISSEYIFVDRVNLNEISGLESFKGKDKTLRLNILAKNFDFDDLKAFLPQVNFLDNDVYLQIKAGGVFDDINIDKLELKTKGSKVNFAGRMRNLTEPDKLWFDIKGTELVIDPDDTRIYLPGLPVSEYSHLGIVKGDISYIGEILDFRTVFNLSSNFVKARGDLSLNLTGSDYLYNGFAEFSALDIGGIIKDPSLKSNINGKIEFNGKGVSLNSLNTTLKYELGRTTIFDQVIEKSSGLLIFRNYNIETDLTYVSPSVSAMVRGNINIRNLNEPIYSLNGMVRNLDISNFTGKLSDKSSLSFSFSLNGRGISPVSMEGEYNFNFLDSYYGSFDIPSTTVNLRLSLKPSFSFINLNSDIVDLSIRGRFKPAEVPEALLSNIYMIQNSISDRFNLDTILPRKSVSVNRSDMNFTYEIITRNPELLERIFFLSDLKFNVKINGSISNSLSGFNGYSKVSFERISYKDTLFAARNLELELKHNNDYSLYSGDNFRSFNSLISVKADEMRNNSVLLDSTNIELNLSEELQDIFVHLGQDSSIRMTLDATIDLSKDKVTFTADTFDLKYYDLKLHNNGQLVISHEGKQKNRSFYFEKFSLSGEILNAELTGRISPDGESDFVAEASYVNIPEIIQFIYDPSRANYEKFKTPLSGYIRRLTLFMKGSLTEPELAMEMNTGIIRYNQIKVGRIDAFIDYANNNLSTDILISNAAGGGKMRLKGNIPLYNPLVTPDSLMYAEVMSNPVDLNLSAKDFQINFFSKIIPNFSDIRGFFNGNLSAKGNITKPELTGEASIEKGRFFFSWTGLYYRFETMLKTSGSDLVVERFSVYNDNDRARHIDVFGRINFAGLGINEIDLLTSGDMYILDNSSIQNRFGFYGEMLGGIGNPPITIKGNLEKLVVAGQLVIKKARIFFPSVSSLEYNIYSDDFTYRILTNPEGTEFLDTLISVSQNELSELDPFLRYNYILQKKETSFSDNIIYDLDILLEKNIYVNMNMNSLTREELNGEFQGNLKLDNKTINKDFQMFGRLNIIGDSYYRFYKNFRIEESHLDFTGDYNNPILEIRAKYTNYRTTATGETEKVYVILDIEGTRYQPKLTLSIEDEYGSVETGPQAQTDAISYLLFGVPQSDVRGAIGSSVLSNLGTNLGSGVASSLLYEALRNIAPFILNTEVTYTGGDISTTDIRVTSAFGDAIVRIGGQILTDINNLEVSIEYPLNRLFDINVSNNLIIEISRIKSTSVFNVNDAFETRAGLTYKIRY